MTCWHCKREVESVEIVRGRYYALINPACPECAKACRAGLFHADRIKDAERKRKRKMTQDWSPERSLEALKEHFPDRVHDPGWIFNSNWWDWTLEKEGRKGQVNIHNQLRLWEDDELVESRELESWEEGIPLIEEFVKPK